MAQQQHVARIDLSGRPHQFEGGAHFAYVGKDGRDFFPTDAEGAHRFYSQKAADKAAAAVARRIRSAAAAQHH